MRGRLVSFPGRAFALGGTRVPAAGGSVLPLSSAPLAWKSVCLSCSAAQRFLCSVLWANTYVVNSLDARFPACFLSGRLHPSWARAAQPTRPPHRRSACARASCLAGLAQLCSQWTFSLVCLFTARGWIAFLFFEPLPWRHTLRLLDSGFLPSCEDVS